MQIWVARESQPQPLRLQEPLSHSQFKRPGGVLKSLLDFFLILLDCNGFSRWQSLHVALNSGGVYDGFFSSSMSSALVAGGFFCFHCRQLLEIAFMSQHFLSSFVLQMELVIMGCVSDMHAQSLQLCPTLCHPVDCSSPGSSVHGISQAKILEWVVIPFCTESSWQRDQTCISCISRQILYHCATWEAL